MGNGNSAIAQQQDLECFRLVGGKGYDNLMATFAVGDLVLLEQW